LVKVTRSYDGALGFEVAKTKSFACNENIATLAEFLLSSEHIPVPPANLIIERNLGEGLTARVFLVAGEAVKVFHKDDVSTMCMDREVKALKTSIPLALEAKCNLFIYNLGQLEERAFSADLLPPLQAFVRCDFEARTLVTTPVCDAIHRTTFNKIALIPIAVDLMNVLMVLHSQGIAHGDVSKFNVMMKDGRAVLIDYGFSVSVMAKPYAVAKDLVCFCVLMLYWGGLSPTPLGLPLTREHCTTLPEQFQAAFGAALDKNHNVVMSEMARILRSRPVSFAASQNGSPNEKLTLLRQAAEQLSDSAAAVDSIVDRVEEMNISQVSNP
jgi:hypothetical protein